MQRKKMGTALFLTALVMVTLALATGLAISYADSGTVFIYQYPIVKDPDFAFVGNLAPGEWTPWIKVTITVSDGSAATQDKGWVASVDNASWPIEADPAPPYTWTARGSVEVNIRVQVPENWTQEGCFTFNAKLRPGRAGRAAVGSGEGVHFKVCVTIPPRASTIRGFKFNDRNANGVWDEGEEGLAGWTINLFKLTEAGWTLVDSAVTGDDGGFTFTVTEAGEYKLTEELMEGWMQTAPAEGFYTLTVELGKTYEGFNFGNVKLAKICGFKFNDRNANGVWDDGEEGMEGVEIRLYKDGDLIATTFTDTTGGFCFKDLMAGTYTVEEVPPEGWMATTPAAQTVTVDWGEEATVYFGNVKLAKICGFKFNDRNANGVWDEGEEGLAGWTINLYKENELIATTTTGENGGFCFENLMAGTYTVEEVLQTGWMATTPATQTITVDWGEEATVYFGNVKLAKICGLVFYDANLNGIKDGDELGVEGVKIELYDAEGNLITTTFTSATGEFCFENLMAGTYTIRIIVPSGYFATTPITRTVTVGWGETSVGNFFGIACLMPIYGARTLGYWANAGNSLITSDDVAYLNTLNLYKPSRWAYPPFSSDINTARTQIRNYLLSANAKDMGWMLSAQLIATVLNVRKGYLSGTTVVYVGPSVYVPSGFITISEIIAKANTALAGTNRSEQAYWKDILDCLNNNKLSAVCPGPCYPIVYP